MFGFCALHYLPVFSPAPNLGLLGLESEPMAVPYSMSLALLLLFYLKAVDILRCCSLFSLILLFTTTCLLKYFCTCAAQSQSYGCQYQQFMGTVRTFGSFG